ncbi:helix-turn-helix transcriptional regulator [Streptomyces sp. NPDC017979]|uniref:helix-turn-helix transcriptional regulator n=1 Tax=Streptomyces sp. NPDC017979 TaxID=3365024 RepID=UPI003793B273
MQKTSARLLTLLSLLQAGRGWSGGELADRLGVTVRTVRRDVDRLRELGYLITTVKGPAGGYLLEAGRRMPPLLFDDEQAVALAVALQTVATGTAVADDAARALATLRQVMPPRLRDRMELLRITAVRPPAGYDARQGDGDVDARVLLDLSRAVRGHEELRFSYARGPGYSRAPDAAATGPATSESTASGPTTVPPTAESRRVEPHHLVAWRHRWYLVAWDLDRADWRTFRVDRIRPRTPTGPRFTPRPLPGGSVSAFVTGRFRGSGETDGGDGRGAATDWPCRGEVVLHLPAASVAPFAEDGVVVELGPDRCRLTLGSWSWTALAAAFGRFDADIDVIGPPELAAAFAALAARYARAAAPRRP